MAVRRWKSALAAGCAVGLVGLLYGGPAGAAPDSSSQYWSFESDQVGSVPAGCVTPDGRAATAVSAEAAHSGKQSLLLADDSATSLPAVSCARPAARGIDLSFAVDPATVPNGFMVDLLGTTTAGTHGVAFHVLFNGAGAVQWYDGGRWLPLAPAGTVPSGRWSTVEVGTTADQDMAYVTLNGHYLGSGGPWGINPITAIDGIQFAGTGTPTQGDRVYFDDVRVGPALPQRPAAVLQHYQVGPMSTVATSSTPVQMPNTAARVHTAHGWRILLSYPAHTDVGETAGNEFVYSDDNGRTWHDYQSHNPMPDAPSYNITQLADGSLLAVNYHSYAASQANQAIIETAVSKDNGATWTRREGLLSGPQDFAPYSCERPTGCTAFVLVHNVLQSSDGTLYQSSYGRYVGDTKYRQVLLVSHDGGLTWTLRATIAYSTTIYPPGTSYEGYCEGVLARTRDGGLIVVMRTSSYLPMYISRSDDDGRTWSEPQQLRTPGNQPVISVYPALNRLADGTLLLMVGRPGYSLLRSTDDGRTWSEATGIDYQNSANGYVLSLYGNTVMMFGDRGANWQSPKQYAVWSRIVTVH